MNALSRFILLVALIATSGCVATIHRTEGFVDNPDCRPLYDQHYSAHRVEVPDSGLAAQCWRRSIEERSAYDLLFVEFDDQGWVQGTSGVRRPATDHIDALFAKLSQLRSTYDKRGLSVVVFVHGWHHNASANDKNVRDFRMLLSDFALAEGGENGRRVVGIYVGWRGESLAIPLLNDLTFWSRKSVAEKVAQGSVRELFAKLDDFRDRGATDEKSRKVRLMTIGHSFGGLVVYESLSSDFLNAAARHNGRRTYLSRLGDLVVIINPAFEGTRYEPLKVAGERLGELPADQLPLVITVTSRADWATRFTFPTARAVNTMFEHDPDDEWQANVKTVGHNHRYNTHKLRTCTPADKDCQSTCTVPAVLLPGEDDPGERGRHIASERAFISGFVVPAELQTIYLCDGLVLSATRNWQPPRNPFWVVETYGEVMKGHNDVYNPNLVAFVRQMYLAVIMGTDARRSSREARRE